MLLTIIRERLDARRSGLATGPGPSEKYGYRLLRDGEEIVGLGYGLTELRRNAAQRMRGSSEDVQLMESWTGGKRYRLTSRGAWKVEE